MHRILAACAVLTLLSACAGNGNGLDDNGNPINGNPGPLVATLDSIQSNVFTPICTTCHAGASAPLGFRLDANSSYAMLVNTPSVEVSSLMRVLPGDPDHSYIIQKLEGHASVGGQMPLGGPYLPQTTIDVIRQWITEGAQPMSGAAANGGLVTLRAIAPMPEERLSSSPREILVAASGELDTSLLEAGTVHLSRVDDAGGLAMAQPSAIEVRSLAPTVIAIRPLAAAFAPGRYELRIAGSGPVALTDRSGLALDGSGAGVAGSDFILTFTVEPTP